MPAHYNIVPTHEDLDLDDDENGIDDGDFNTHWHEPQQRLNGKYILPPNHRFHIDNRTTRSSRKKTADGPNQAYLAQQWATLPQWLRKTTSEWTTSDLCAQGMLAPMHIFWLWLFKLDVLKLVPLWSNKRMTQIFATNNKYGDCTKEAWKSMDKHILLMVSVLQVFLGLYGGSLNLLFHEIDGVSSVREVMAQARFELWRRAITMYDPTKPAPRGDQHSDNAYKVTYFFKKFASIARLFWSLPEKLSIDEQIMAMKNRCYLKRIIRTKIHMIGAKFWKIAFRVLLRVPLGLQGKQAPVCDEV